MKRRGTSAAGRHRTADLVCYRLIVAGLVPVAVRLLWLVGSSLKSRDSVFAAPPTWLPRSQVYAVDTADGVLRLEEQGRREDAQGGYVKARVVSDQQGEAVAVDEGSLTSENRVFDVALIDGVEREVAVLSETIRTRRPASGGCRTGTPMAA